MQKCLKCTNRFTWKEITKYIWVKGYEPIECDQCNTIHYFNWTTRLSVAAIIGVPPILTHKIRYTYIELGHYFILVYLLVIALGVCLTPFYARYHMED